MAYHRKSSKKYSKHNKGFKFRSKRKRFKYASPSRGGIRFS